MAQRLTVIGFEGDTYTVNVYPAFTDAVAEYTKAGVTGFSTGGVTRFRVTDIPDSVSGIRFVELYDAGLSKVAWSGWARFTGVADTEHVADPSYAAVQTAQIVGAGADIVTLIVSETGGTPVADANVWITSDLAGENVVAGTRITDSGGQVDFLLDLGSTYYMWAQKDGWQGIQGSPFVAA